MIRILLILIPVITFIIPARFFAYYATILIAAAVYGMAMFTLLNDQAETRAIKTALCGRFGCGLSICRTRSRFKVPGLPASNARRVVGEHIKRSAISAKVHERCTRCARKRCPRRASAACAWAGRVDKVGLDLGINKLVIKWFNG